MVLVALAVTSLASSGFFAGLTKPAPTAAARLPSSTERRKPAERKLESSQNLSGLLDRSEADFIMIRKKRS